MKREFKKRNTSWEAASNWYNRITKDKGHYYHEHVVIPNSLRLLNLRDNSSLLDLGCGNGVLAKNINQSIKYMGIDLSENLIKNAKKEDKNYSHKYLISDATKIQNFHESFTHSAMILSFQNMRNPQGAIKNAFNHLEKEGKLLIVLNHPMFRIPRQTSWGEDTAKKLQYRRVDSYMSKMEIPIKTNPSDIDSSTTLSFHFPFWLISKMLNEEGFVIEKVEEWTSDKESFGKAAKMENRSRNEIPLFMAILAKKLD